MKVEILDGMFVRRFGDPQAPKLLCLHGFADSGHMFVPLADTTLGEHFELIVVDLPGFGASLPNAAVHSVEEFAQAVAGLAASVSPGKPVGLIGHSVASAIAVATVGKLATPALGVFSIEGNLTAADAYFSGRAADWDSAALFKQAFLDEIWRESEESPDLRRYFGGAVLADADTMWNLGRDARKLSANDTVGNAYKALNVPTLYYWGTATTTSTTRDFVERNALVNRQYEVASHWPTVADPGATAAAIDEFFGGLT